MSGKLITVFLVVLSAPDPALPQAAPVTWRLSARPALTIAGEGNPRTRFLRVGTVLRLPNGEIVVPNGGTNEIRVFDQRGRFLRAMGRTGSGPGEFRSLRLVARAGDTLFIADRVNARIAEILVDGTPVRTIPLAARDVAAGANVVGRFIDGRWAVVTTSRPNLNGPQRTYRDTSQVGILAPGATGGAIWIGTFPSLTIFVYNPASAPQGEVAAPVPGGSGWVSATTGDEILIGDTGSNVIGAYSMAGARLRLITLPLEAQPLTDDRLARFLKRALQGNSSIRTRPYITALHSREVMGRTLPVFGDILPASDGSLWVHEGPEDLAEPSSWLVLDTLGKPKATLVAPAGFRITDVGPSYVLGVHTDADGVETVRMYQLTIP